MNSIVNRETKFIDLGLIDYKDAWDYQTRLFEDILAIKSANRSGKDIQPTPNFLIFCEHPHVYTLGKSGDEKNLLIQKDVLKSVHASYYQINRGGDITYHGPGQLVAYPVIDLENFFTDIHQYMRLLEESVIQTVQHFSVDAGRIKGLTGVWVEPEARERARKICAFGVKMSRWATLHGLALNVNTDLSYFNHIVPCGLVDRAVTSLKNETGTLQDIVRVKETLKENIFGLFGMTLIN